MTKDEKAIIKEKIKEFFRPLECGVDIEDYEDLIKINITCGCFRFHRRRGYEGELTTDDVEWLCQIRDEVYEKIKPKNPDFEFVQRDPSILYKSQQSKP